MLKLRPIQYKEEGWKIGIRQYQLDAMAWKKLRKCVELKYSKTYSCWYFAFEAALLRRVLEAFPDAEYVGELPKESPKSAEKTAEAAPQNATITICEEDNRRGWWVACARETGQALKKETSGAVWFGEKRLWFVPARKGNWGELERITGEKPPFLTFPNREERPEKLVRIELHPQRLDYVLVHLPYSAEAYELIQATNSRYFDKSLSRWTIPNTAALRVDLVERFEQAGFRVEVGEEVEANTIGERSGRDAENREYKGWLSKLPLDLQPIFAAYIDTLMLRNYSVSTIKNYRLLLWDYCQAHAPLSPDNISSTAAQAWLTEKVRTGWGASSLVSAVSALRFYYIQMLRRNDWEFFLPFPRREEKLPNILGQREVRALFDAVNNLKHRTMLLMGYAAGLRVSEVVGLRLADIDSERMVITIKASKGNKDRCVMLSETLLDTLRMYYKAYLPKDWLFEGMHCDRYSVRSLQKIFQRAKEAALIRKEVSFHSLRHSFATHLHEGGTDIRIIQELLGHNSPKTTEIYTHVSTRTIQRVKSPLDNLPV